MIIINICQTKHKKLKKERRRGINFKKNISIFYTKIQFIKKVQDIIVIIKYDKKCVP